MTAHGEKSRIRSPSPLPSMHSMPRLLLGSPRRLAGFVGWLCLFYVAWRYLDTSSLASSDPLHCDPPRYQLSRNIKIPKTPDVGLLNSTWLTLESIFQAHPPHPEKLPQIPFKNGYEMPELELIKNHTNLSTENAKSSRESHLEVVKALPEYPGNTFSGRGIIMLAGGRYNLYAATALGVIRETGSKLPVEVWMNETSEEKQGWCDELAKEGMVCKWLNDYVDGRFLQNGYQLKILTMMFSSFEQFLFLDADNQPVKNPDAIFDTKSFVDNGAILWPDYWGHTGAPLLPYVVGLADKASEVFRETKTVESGQIAWDKKKHWKSLCLAAYYNHYGPDFYYTLITQGFAGWGDKDTFPLALKALKEDYYMVPFGLNTMFLNGTRTGVAMMQGDPANQTGYEPLFLHTNIVKWNPREFLCVGCASDEEDPVEVSDLEKEQDKSFVHKSLIEHERIYDYGVAEQLGIDPEPLLWKSMEHNVCKSAWQNKDLCTRVREHMTDAFGFQFRTRTVSRVFRDGYEVEEVCRKRGP